MKNKSFIVIFIAIILIGILIYGFYTNIRYGFFIVDTGWRNSVEEAIEQERFDPDRGQDSYRISQIIDIIYDDNYASVIYVSKADTLAIAGCVGNDKNKWKFYGFSEEADIKNPNVFVLNGDLNQDILIPYQINHEKQEIYGFKYHEGPSIYVNEVPSKTKTYKIMLKGKELKIDYWWVESIEINDSTDFDISYVS